MPENRKTKKVCPTGKKVRWKANKQIVGRCWKYSEESGENKQGIEMPGNWSWRRPRSCVDGRASGEVPVFTGQAYHPIITGVSQWESLLW